MTYKHGQEVSYIGDGVYAYFDYDEGQVYIYISNGIKESDPIALNDDTILSLIQFAKNHFPKGVI